MSFASDIRSTTITDTATAVAGRTRIAGVYFVNTTTAATLTFRDGGSGGTTVMELNTPPVAGATYLVLQNNGILCSTDLHVTFSSAEVTSCTIFYVGGNVPPPEEE